MIKSKKISNQKSGSFSSGFTWSLNLQKEACLRIMIARLLSQIEKKKGGEERILSEKQIIIIPATFTSKKSHEYHVILQICLFLFIFIFIF